MQHEKRKFPRLSTSDQGYGIRFQVRGLAVQDSVW